MFAEGFRIIINTAWGLLNFTIIPSGAFGSHGNITFLNFLYLGIGGVLLVKFVRFCIGGNFNDISDKGRARKWRSEK